MNVRKSIKPLFVLIVAVFMSGCSTFRSEIKGKFGGTPSKNYEAEKVNVLFIFRHVKQSIGYDAVPKLENQRQRLGGFDDIFNDALQEISNIKTYATFTDYASDVNKPERRALKDSLIARHDFVINITFLKEKSFAKHFLGYIFSTASVTMLPIPYSQSYSVKLDVYNARGLLVKSYKREASLTKWVQTLLIFVYPFHNEERKKEEIYVTFLHDIFKEIETKKIILKKSAGR